jgi:enediyne biosynthesis protein E4
LDVLIVNLNEPPSLLRNDLSGKSHWLKVKLVGSKSNRSAIGATVTLRYGALVQKQAVLSQSSYYSVNDSRLHFGLGDEKSADIEIRWPSGLEQKLKAVPADQLVTILEGSGIVPSKGWSR